MGVVSRCLVAALLTLTNVNAMAFEPRVQGPHAPLWYLLQVVDGRTVTPMGGEESMLKMVARDQAEMYIHGVIDTGEARQWCIYLSNLPPHEVIDEVLTGLRALPPTAKDRNAALAISDFLKVRFPCQKKPVHE